MCGICGFLVVGPGHVPSREDLVSMTNTIRHRGPDNEGYYLKNGVGLGHRRLSIIDLSENGRQPMNLAGTGLQIIFNGEVYNYQELRRELEGLGASFRTRTDTEVLLEAYRRWGTACVNRFNGMFAMALYDESTGELVLMRDRLGVKPLYYAWDERRLIFGSELKAVTAYPGFEKRLDMRAVESYFAFKYVPAPLTIYEGVWKLRPGHLLIVRNGKIREERYWDPVAVALSQEPASDKMDDGAAQEEFEALFESSVRYRLISDVPIGALLSGGIDSSLVVSEMCRQGKDVRTFTVAFDDPAYNEAPFAASVARTLGTRHEELMCSTKDLFDSIGLLAYHYDEPFADPSSLPTYLVSKLARRHVTVALAGDAGDELFWGYSRYRKYAAALRGSFLPHVLRDPLFGALRLIPHDIIQKAAAGMQFRSADDLYQYLNSMFKGKDLDRLFTTPIHNRPTLIPSDETRLDGLSDLERPPVIDLLTYLPDDIMTKVDRASMAVALEARGPLLDYRIVEFALKLPLRMKYRDGSQKWLLKRTLFNRIDRKLFDRPKQGFDLPLNQWLRKELRPMLLERLNARHLRRFPFINGSFVEELVKKHLSGSYDYYYMLWTLLSFDIWYDHHMAGAQTPAFAQEHA